MSLSSDARHEAERLVRAGQKLQAVKYLHDHFHVSLAEGKQLVDALELELNHAQPVTTATVSADYEAEAERLLRHNKKIEAVKYVHQ